jgi:hypothetical protein
MLIALTKESGQDEISSALGYGLPLAQEAGAHATVQAASAPAAFSHIGATTPTQ